MPCELRIQRPDADISAQEFQKFVDGAGFEQVPEMLIRSGDDGVERPLYRIMHPTGAPWMVADYQTFSDGRPSRIELSISSTNFKFVRVWSDAFDAALKAAGQLRAGLIEEGGTQITADNIDKLLDFEGEYVQFHLKVWNKSMWKLNMENYAPLEFPLGPVDAVKEYFCFNVKTDSPVTMRRLTDEVGLSIRLNGDSMKSGTIYDPETERPMTKIFLRDDGKVQVQPFYFKESFAVAADETLDMAEAINRKFGGEITFFSEPLTPEFRAILKDKMNSLGIDFYLWMKHKSGVK